MKKNSIKNKILIAASILVLILIILLFFLLGSNSSAETILQEIKKDSITMKFSSSGTIKSSNEKHYLVNPSLVVSKILVRQGQYVKSGENLIEYTNGSFDSADFDGVVSFLNKNALPTQPLLSLAEKSGFYLSLPVNVFEFSDLIIGQVSKIKFLEKEYTGKIDFISKAIEQRSDSFGADVPTVDVSVSIDDIDENLILGFSADIDVITSEKADIITIPISSVKFDNEGTYCYINDNMTAKKVYIKTGISSESLIEVISGVKLGEEVITNITSDIQDGKKISIVK
ncbi:MAG: hypothetical protein KFW09_02410 [Oscillospiraceae bacterium]|nr:hypothetical protein [Oscillospiraceae bacterium]